MGPATVGLAAIIEMARLKPSSAIVAVFWSLAPRLAVRVLALVNSTTVVTEIVSESITASVSGRAIACSDLNRLLLKSLRIVSCAYGRPSPQRYVPIGVPCARPIPRKGLPAHAASRNDRPTLFPQHGVGRRAMGGLA